MEQRVLGDESFWQFLQRPKIKAAEVHRTHQVHTAELSDSFEKTLAPQLQGVGSFSTFSQPDLFQVNLRFEPTSCPSWVAPSQQLHKGSSEVTPAFLRRPPASDSSTWAEPPPPKASPSSGPSASEPQVGWQKLPWLRPASPPHSYLSRP